eukprot:jgi/Hompol1/3131/HPOL_006383-RA
MATTNNKDDYDYNQDYEDAMQFVEEPGDIQQGPSSLLYGIGGTAANRAGRPLRTGSGRLSGSFFGADDSTRFRPQEEVMVDLHFFN